MLSFENVKWQFVVSTPFLYSQEQELLVAAVALALALGSDSRTPG